MGANGVKNKKPVKWEELLALTDGGYSIFKKELGNFPICRAFSHPLKRDRHSSGAIFPVEGVWFLKDFAGDIPTMTAVQYIQRKYSLNFGEAIDKICHDIGLNTQTREYKPIGIMEKAPVYEVSDVHISFSERKWIGKHHKFWENTGVDKEHCEKYSTFAVKDAAINKRRVQIGKDEVVWAYYIPEMEKVKLYFPERNKNLRHRGNVPNNWIWGLNNIEQCDKLIVQKSMKDLLVTTIITPCVVALQNEDAKLFVNAETGEKLEKCGKKIFLAFGSDEHGVKNSKLLTDEYNYKWVNPPKFLLQEDINDAYALSHKYGIDAWRECLKQKNII